MLQISCLLLIMTSVYGIFYCINTFSTYGPTVKVIYYSEDLNKIKEFVSDNFTDLSKGINNTYYATYNESRCIMWINSFELDKEIKDVGLGCNQPSSALDIFS